MPWQRLQVYKGKVCAQLILGNLAIHMMFEKIMTNIEKCEPIVWK